MEASEEGPLHLAGRGGPIPSRPAYRMGGFMGYPRGSRAASFLQSTNLPSLLCVQPIALP